MNHVYCLVTTRYSYMCPKQFLAMTPSQRIKIEAGSALASSHLLTCTNFVGAVAILSWVSLIRAIGDCWCICTRTGRPCREECAAEGLGPPYWVASSLPLSIPMSLRIQPDKRATFRTPYLQLIPGMQNELCGEDECIRSSLRRKH